ncbi:MAG: class I SAM-dependent methyltransferase [Nitrospiraceae bacterium]
MGRPVPAVEPDRDQPPAGGGCRLQPGMQMLDLGSGTGYPALLAGQVVGPSGSVVGLDLAESMLSVATHKAAELGLRHVNFRTGDVSTLPFEDGAFDAVISHFCLMFLPDAPKAAKEIARVLAPGGYLAAAVWASPDKNPSIRIPMDILKTLVTLPAPGSAGAEGSSAWRKPAICVACWHRRASRPPRTRNSSRHPVCLS